MNTRIWVLGASHGLFQSLIKVTFTSCLVSVLHVNFSQLSRERPLCWVGTAVYLTVFLLFNYLLDWRWAEPTYKKHWELLDGMAVFSCSPHSGLASENVQGSLSPYGLLHQSCLAAPSRPAYSNPSAENEHNLIANPHVFFPSSKTELPESISQDEDPVLELSQENGDHLRNCDLILL